jgi:predicted amidohydrolase YtcJ
MISKDTRKGARVFHNGNVITLDPSCPRADTVVVENGRFVFVGRSEEAGSRFGGVQDRIDLGGRTVLPGFIDSHCHLSLTGYQMLWSSLEPAATVADCLEIIRGAASAAPGIFVVLTGLDDSRLYEGRLPTRQELDSAVPNRPVVAIYFSGHGTLVNTAALNILRDEANKRGIAVRDDDAASGFIRGKANDLIQRLALDLLTHEERLEGLRQAVKACLRTGVTSVHSMEGQVMENDPAVNVLMEAIPTLPIDVRMYYQSTIVREVVSKGLTCIGGCGQVILDGDFAPHTAALLEPYTDRPETSGTQFFTDEQLQLFFMEANRAGLQVSVHAVGDGAVEQALRAYEVALRDFPRENHRHRIEHFEIPQDRQIEKARQLGICLGMQPAFDYYWDVNNYAQFMGRERAERRNAFRKILDAGIPIGGGSDSYVTPINPLLGVHSCLNHSVPGARIGLTEALHLFTSGAAYLGFEETEKGTITVGKKADMVELEQDIYSVPRETVKDIAIAATIKGGNVVWSGSGAH